MNKPMEDFVTRGGLGELMAAAQQALEGLHAQQQPSGFRTIPLPSETAPHVGPGTDTTQWWNITRRLSRAIYDAEKARELELNTAHPCAGCDVTDRAAQKRCISDNCPAKLRLDAEDGIATVACPGCGTSYRFGRANPARVECGECKTRFACMAELLLAHRRERGLD